LKGFRGLGSPRGNTATAMRVAVLAAVSVNTATSRVSGGVDRHRSESGGIDRDRRESGDVGGQAASSDVTRSISSHHAIGSHCF
jgi:hypothetical protein